MKIEIQDPALEARIQRQIRATGAASAEEALRNLLDMQEEQDRWLLEDREPINAKIRRGMEQLDRRDCRPVRSSAFEALCRPESPPREVQHGRVGVQSSQRLG
jgi:hypothetical protein